LVCGPAGNPAESSLEVAIVIGLAQHSSSHDQPGLTHQLGDTVRLPPVEIEADLVSLRLGSVRQLVADLKRKLHVATRGEHPMEFGEDLRQLFVRDMDDRVPGHDAAESTSLEVQGCHRTLNEPQSWIRPAGDRDHLRRQIDPEHGQSEAAQMCRHAAGTAPDVGDRPGTGGLHEFGEPAEQCPVQWLSRKFVTDPLGIVGGQGVIGRTGAVKEVRFGHGRAPYSADTATGIR
jgi:hypothetical protein